MSVFCQNTYFQIGIVKYPYARLPCDHLACTVIYDKSSFHIHRPKYINMNILHTHEHLKLHAGRGSLGEANLDVKYECGVLQNRMPEAARWH